MAVRIANLKILVSASTRGVVTGMGKAGRSVKSFGSGVLKSVVSLKGFVVGLVAVVGVTTAVNRGLATMRTQFEELDKLGKTASKLGTTVEALQKVRFAAKLTGTEIDATDNALVKFTKATAEAAEGTGEAIRSLEAMGIEAKTLIGLPLEKQLLKIADGLQRLGKEEKLLAVSRLFGRSGTEFVNTLKQGSAALDEMFKERGDLGLFTAQQVKQIEDANDAMSRLGIQVNFVAGSIAAELSPLVAQLSTDMVEMGKDGELSFDNLTVAVKAFTLSIALAIDKVDQLASKFKVDIPASKAGKKLAKEFGGAFKDGIKNILGTAGTPTVDAVQAFFDRLDERVRKTREDSFGRGGLIPDPASGGGGVKLPAALERGSAAAFSFLAKGGLEGKDLQKAAVRNGELQLTALDQITAILRNLLKEQQGKLEGAAV